MLRRRTLMAMVASASWVMPLAAVAQEPVKLKFAFWLSDKGSDYRDVLKPWVERVEAASEGAVKIKIYTGGTLGRDPAAQLKMVEDGVADIAYPVPNYTPGRFPENSITDLPGLFSSSTEASTVMWGLYEQGLLSGFDGLKVLGLFGSQPFTIDSVRATTKLADLEGQKLRAAGKYAIPTVELLGAAAVGLTVSESAEALTRGVIDGVTSHPSLSSQTGSADIARNHYLLGLHIGHVMLVMKQEAFDALPEKARVAINAESGLKLSRAWGEVQDRDAQALIAKWSENGSGHTVTRPSAADLAAVAPKFEEIRAIWQSEDPARAKLLDAAEALKTDVAR
ncbi:hypothetical protein F9L06_24920 [Brucella anthropi]|uniref:Uncharacterized protein n=1 Tax=Brucella anthropi TaxID=529 RepID=A0A6I0DME9_BRUAN|nr:TRAP transporter substrate-binding protein DctP [Brucella anthropi]KAB2790317.1 hypothetical protein F9L06_24920 [Brucella anthropi]